MAGRAFYVPQTNLLGARCLNDFGAEVVRLGFKKVLVVSDSFLNESGIVKKVTDQLDANNIEFILYTEVTPNPTCAQVNKGLDI